MPLQKSKSPQNADLPADLSVLTRSPLPSSLETDGRIRHSDVTLGYFGGRGHEGPGRRSREWPSTYTRALCADGRECSQAMLQLPSSVSAPGQRHSSWDGAWPAAVSLSCHMHNTTEPRQGEGHRLPIHCGRTTFLSGCPTR